MEFGRGVDIQAVDFRLPEDPPGTARVLRSGSAARASGGLTAYLGCPRWGLPRWVGAYYPRGAARTEYLAHYGRLFNAVELNSTYYALPARSTLEQWARSVPPGFRFAPKVHRSVSHAPGLRDAAGALGPFVDSVRLLGTRLGVCFLQLPPALGPASLPELEALLRAWPADLELAVELRHPAWFAGGDQVFGLLERHGAAAVITDSAGRRDAVHMRLTSGTAFVRFQGNNLHPSDFTRADAWVERVCRWADGGLERLYLFVHQPDERGAPELVAAFAETLNARLGLELAVPRPIQGELTSSPPT